MNGKLKNYDYSRKILFIEDESNNFRKEIDDKTIISNNDYQYKIVNSITRKEYQGIVYDLIQHDDVIIGWVELKLSPQIFRFSGAQCKVVDDIYFDNNLNEKMGNTRNYKLLFKDKVLSARCEIRYEDEVYYGLFLNGQFQGFHNEKIIDFHIPVDFSIDVNPKETVMYKISNLTVPIENKVKNLNITGVFKKHKIGKVKLPDQKTPYWIDISNISIDFKYPHVGYTEDEKFLNDIFEFIKIERNKSKEIANKVLSVRDYLIEIENKN